MAKLTSNLFFEGKVYIKGEDAPKGYKGKNVAKAKAKAKEEDKK